jgi:hypothetical protein
MDDFHVVRIKIGRYGTVLLVVKFGDMKGVIESIT